MLKQEQILLVIDDNVIDCKVEVKDVAAIVGIKWVPIKLEVFIKDWHNASFMIPVFEQQIREELRALDYYD